MTVELKRNDTKQKPSEFLPAESRFMEFLSEYGKKVLYILLFLIAIFIFMYRMSVGSTAGAIQDYLNADSDYLLLKESTTNEATSPGGPYEKILDILKRHPELHGKYDGLIAQAFLAKGNADLALPFAEQSLDLTEQNHLPLYADFSKITLLISKEKYNDAYRSSLELKKQIEENEKNFSTNVLYIFNLLRLAELEQQVGTQKGELVALKELLKLAKEGSEGMQALAANYQEGDVSLISYLERKIKMLQK